MDCSPAHFSDHGIFQAIILEGVGISFSRGLPNPEVEPTSPALAGGVPTSEAPEKPLEKESCESAKPPSLLQAVNSIVPNGSVKTPVLSKLSINRAWPPEDRKWGGYQVWEADRRGRVWREQPQLFTKAHL